MNNEDFKNLKEDILNDMDILSAYFFGLIAKNSPALKIAERFFKMYSKINYIFDETTLKSNFIENLSISENKI